jgi:hypothetical protein
MEGTFAERLARKMSRNAKFNLRKKTKRDVIPNDTPDL